METHNQNQTESDVYNILITPSSMYFNYALVVMLSAMLNCKKSCRFFIMQCDWTDEQKRMCEDFVSEYPGNRVEFLNVDINVFSSIDFFKPWHGHYAVNFKLIAHNYLPDYVERILYLETDSLVRKDIDQYYNIDFEDAFLSADVTPTCARTKHEDYAKEEKKGSGDDSVKLYISVGGNMLNVKKFKENKITLEFYEEAVKKAGYTPIYDEGMLLLLFWDKTKLYPFYYYDFCLGCYKEYREIRETTDAQERAATYNSVYAEDFDEDKFATIVHFNGLVAKPWQTVEKNGALMDSGNILTLGSEYNTAIEPFYLEWWETAKKLPQKFYEEIVSNARDGYHQYSIDSLQRIIKRTTDTKNFFESLANDHCNGSHNFENFILKIKNKKLSILNNGSEVGKFFTKIAEQNGIDIVFQSHTASMTKLCTWEWEICKKADVIVSCFVHGGAVLERDNIKGILISDILKGVPLPTQTKS